MVDLSFFNPNDVPQSDNDFDVLPAGWYRAKIVGSEEKQTKRGDGSYLSLQFCIIGPSDGSSKFENRRVFTNLNLNNPNPKAVEIATRDLADICRAVGVLSPQTSEQLHEKPLMIKLSIRRSEEWGDSNEVKGYRPMQGAGAPRSGSPAPAAGGGARPGWASKS